VKALLRLILFGLGACPCAPAAVRYLPEQKAWILDSERTTYALAVNERGELQNLYWGKKIAHHSDLFPVSAPNGEEFPGWGGMRFEEPCLKLTRADGVRDLVLKYASHNVSGDKVEIRLKDIRDDLYVTLVYRMHEPTGILRKQVHVENRTGQTVTLESAQSGVWQLPRADGYRLSFLTGQWGNETQLVQEEIRPGLKILESRRGHTSHQMNPWFAIDRNGRADEEHGAVWFGALGWSGNWKLAIEQTPDKQVRVTGGYNTFDFSYVLKAGDNLTSPPFYGGFSNGGFGEASRLLHRFQRDAVLPRRTTGKPRPVLYNSWYATTFKVDEPGQKLLAGKAAKLGVELFVIDDGWFAGRKNDHAGLGDWYPDKDKFPNGLQGLISHVNKLGMDFGLWVEPEMINARSQLYRAHPDWILNFPERPRSEHRNQLVLNMARDDVKEHIFGVLDRLLTENNIRFLKWDMNRSLSEPGWPELPPAEQKKMWVRYVSNLYEVIDRLRAKHPNLEIESCSGGGGRADMGIMERVEQFWTSDNTEAFDRLRIQEGFSFAYPPKTMVDWVIDVPDMNHRSAPLKYRFLVAMMGSLGIGADLNKCSEPDMAMAARMVAYYKKVRETVQHGDLYRLLSPRDSNVAAAQYVAKDGKQSVLFGFLHSQQFNAPTPAIYLRGLEEKALYRITTIDDKLMEGQRTVSGSFLANHGLNFKLGGDYDSTSVLLERVE
jgi:alpha-galactosidase